MPEIETMLDEATKARILAKIADDEPAKAKETTKAETPKWVVTKRAVDPNPPRRLTAADAIDIDPRSGAMIDALCVDCRVPLMIDPAVPEGVDPATPRIPICAKCAKVRAHYEAITAQRNVEVIRRTQVAARQPRTDDGLEHPVAKRPLRHHRCKCPDCKAYAEQMQTPVETPEKEQDMDLNNIPDAELGATLKEQMRIKEAKRIKKERKKAKREQAAVEERAKEQRAEAQAERKGKVLPAFMVGTTLEIPALVLSDIASMDECPSAKERSPYNKARFRLEKSTPLDPEDTTYRVLAKEHERLMALEQERVTESLVKQPKVAEPEVSERAAESIVDLMVGDKEMREPAQVVADLDPAMKAKVKLLAKTMGLSKKEARKVLEAMAK